MRSAIGSPFGFQLSSGIRSSWKISCCTRGNAVSTLRCTRCTDTGELSWSNEHGRPSADTDGPNPQPRCASRVTKCGASTKFAPPTCRLSSRSFSAASAKGCAVVSTRL